MSSYYAATLSLIIYSRQNHQWWEKAIENAKTGKVTAVVTVMYLNGKSKVYLQCTNLQKSEILIGTKGPFEHSKRLIVAERLSGSSLTLGQVGTSFSWKKDPLHASPLLEGLSQSHRVLPMAPFKTKRWATSRYPLWTTLTAKGFTWSLILSSMPLMVCHHCTI